MVVGAKDNLFQMYILKHLPENSPTTKKVLLPKSGHLSPFLSASDFRLPAFQLQFFV